MEKRKRRALRGLIVRGVLLWTVPYAPAVVVGAWLGDTWGLPVAVFGAMAGIFAGRKAHKWFATLLDR